VAAEKLKYVSDLRKPWLKNTWDKEEVSVDGWKNVLTAARVKQGRENREDRKINIDWKMLTAAIEFWV
jgi:hypothetical protein